MPHVMFACTGNICRSPFAERYAVLLARRQGASGWTFSSAGTAALVGAPMSPGMQAQLESRGGSADGFSSTQLGWNDLAGVDWVVTMAVRHREYVLRERPELFRRVLTLGQLVGGAARAGADVVGEDLLVAAGDLRLRPTSADDVPDPYRRGSAAEAAAADRIAADLDDVLTRILR